MGRYASATTGPGGVPDATFYGLYAEAVLCA